MKKYHLLAGLMTILAAGGATMVASHWALNEPRIPSMLSK